MTLEESHRWEGKVGLGRKGSVRHDRGSDEGSTRFGFRRGKREESYEKNKEDVGAEKYQWVWSRTDGINFFIGGSEGQKSR